MKSKTSKHDKARQIIRWFARIISSLSITYFLFAFIGGLIEDFGPITIEGLLIGFFVTWLTIGVITSWMKERIGGIILTIGGIAFAIFIYFTAGSYRILASTLISAPFSLSGILFFILNARKLDQ